MLLATLVVFREPAALLRQGHQALGKFVVALVLKLAHGHAAAGAAWVARHKRQVAFLGACRAERQIVPCSPRLAICAIDSQERHVKVVTRKIEVVGVTPEKSNRIFRRENQADVLHAAVFVQLVLAATKQCDDVTAHVITCRTAFFNRRNGGFLHLVEPLGWHTCGGGLHGLRHVGDRRQLIDFHAWTTRLVNLLGGDKTIAVEVFFSQARKALDALASTMMVGHHETRRRHN